MASGRPFIATNVNGLREVVEGAGELFECGNADQLVSLLINFFNDREYYDRIVRDCMNRALKYDIRTVAAKYQHEYETLTVHS